MSPDDEARLARGLGMTRKRIRRKVTKKGIEKGTRVLRHRSDDIFESACRFLDSDSRQCTIYEHRPQACRDYPGTVRCGYYDFLSSERRRQESPGLVITAFETDLD